MEQKSLSRWLKLILAGTGICGVVVYAAVFPLLGLRLREAIPSHSSCFWPWLLFLWGSAVPCFLVLFYGWRIAGNIGRDRSFSEQNAVFLKRISVLAALDAAYFFAGNLLFLMLGASRFDVMLASLVVVFVGVSVSVAAAVLSHLVKKAAALQEQSDWTI